MAKVAFLGLGVMGYPMAGHLSRAGHDVTVYNRTSARAEAWLEDHAGATAATPAAAARGQDFVLLCVGNDQDVREVVSGPQGALPEMESGAVLIDHTTASADVAREVGAAAAVKGVGFLDAPVSGGQAGAQKGVLTIMIGGEAGVFERSLPILECYSQRAALLGEVGSGQLTKMVNQIAIAGLVQGLSEGLAFADAAGLDPRAVVDVIGKGAAQSWQMDNRAETMIDDHFDHGFAVEWMRKDLAIALSEARRNGACLPVAALVDQFYSEVEAMGGARWDTSSLIRRLRHSRKAP